MGVKVDDLMVAGVMTTTPQQTVGRVREVMRERRVSCMPVIDAEGAPIGIVTATDLLSHDDDEARVSKIMTENVFVVPRYADAAQAARMMRKHRIHHVVVTHEKKVVGIVSTFDLLQLLEERKYVPKVRKKGNPNVKRRSGGRPDTFV